MQKKGFTLIELLVVIAIIGILSSIGLVSLNGAREKARDAKRKNDLSMVRTALMLFYDGNKAYPDQNSVAPLSNIGSNLVTAYLSALPTGSTDQYYYISGPLDGPSRSLFALMTKLEGARKNWYVVNSLGYSGEIAGTKDFLAGDGYWWSDLVCDPNYDTTSSITVCDSAPVHID